MRLIKEQLNIIQSLSEEGAKKELAHNVLEELNNRIELFLVQEHFDPNALKHQSILFPDPVLQAQSTQDEIKMGEVHPELLMPAALDATIKDLNLRISKDLLLFVHEESFDGVLSFVISTSSFGMSFSSSFPETEKKMIENQLKLMKEQGYVIDRHASKTRKHTLEYCEENTSRIEAYLKNLFHSVSCCYDVKNFVIDRIRCRAVFKSDYPFLTEKSEQPEVSDVLSADEAVVAKQVIHSFLGSLSCYSFMDDKNMMLRLYESYTSQLEEIFNCELSISKRIHERYRDIRKKNIDSKEKMQKAGQEAMKLIGSDFKSHYESVKNGISDMLRPWALSVSEFYLMENRFAKIVLRPRTYYNEVRASDVCDAVCVVSNYEKDMRCFEIPYTDHFLNPFMEYLNKYWKDAKIASLEMGNDKILFLQRIIIHGDISNFIQSILENFSVDEQFEDI